eukprot:5390848-Prymnesium_polylepis.1
MAKLIPELVERTKKMINCDRASIFVYDPTTEDLTTILADSTDQARAPHIACRLRRMWQAEYPDMACR